MIDPDMYFIEMMQAILEPVLDQMTPEQAAMEAIADYRTEQQAARMGVAYE
ncbi:hypothetical protein [Pantoea piersonii]|jgi:hypothetical protein|uniref:hypothetical protein n=1 Tax=Pantoea piersonii TaxID=2364647 RepID=UPI0013141474|nr:hypothetical protein [Pantoea piersonii]MBZ6385099.1 hypothetical protein [Pantoea piersonii]MBZ6385175.1 hypothetical protein [Pantoea piersonii]MBZ6398627.1 hypothetical protein [Pantoea piersonii]MBZ6398703.1 hypothetical protein [Pantoea piersonii]MBZ6406557.1 hypothetical protein [Pantoea piersonii]